MLLVVNNFEVPGESLPFDPLTTHQRCPAVIFFVELYMAHNGVQVGVSNGLTQCFFLKGACSSQGIGRNFIPGMLISKGLKPFLAGSLCPGVTKVFGALTGQRRLKGMVGTPPDFCG